MPLTLAYILVVLVFWLFYGLTAYLYLVWHIPRDEREKAREDGVLSLQFLVVSMLAGLVAWFILIRASWRQQRDKQRATSTRPGA